MKNYLLAIFIASIVGMNAAHAGNLYPGVAAAVILSVGSESGIGVRRGPYDGRASIYPSYFNGYYRGFNRGYWTGYRDGYADASIPSLLVDQGACSGSAIYRVCSAYGTCWAACY